MRQRSITGPLVLVLLGTAFLIHNLRPDLLAWRAIGDYWPFLLIALGLIGLVEVLVSASRGPGSGPVQKPLGGTGWLWIVIPVAIIGTMHDRGELRTRSFDAPRFAVFGSDWDYDVNVTGDGSGVKRVVLDGLRGNVTLKGDGGAGIRVTGHKTVRATSHGEADRADKASAIRVERLGDAAVIRLESGAGRDAGQISGELEIAVPRGVTVESKTRAGELTVDEIDGGVEATAGRGDVRVNHVGGDVHVTGSRGGLIHVAEVKGGVTLQGRGSDVELITVGGPVAVNGEYSGTLEFRGLAGELRFNSERTELRAAAVPGTVTLDLSDLRLSQVTGPVRFRTSSRDVHVSEVSGGLELEVERGDLEIVAARGAAGKMDAHTRNGDIDLVLPAGAGFDVNATTGQGEAENEYGGALTVEGSGRRHTVRGKTGNGPQITVETGRGAVTVKRG